MFPNFKKLQYVNFMLYCLINKKSKIGDHSSEVKKNKTNEISLGKSECDKHMMYRKNVLYEKVC